MRARLSALAQKHLLCTLLWATLATGWQGRGGSAPLACRGVRRARLVCKQATSQAGKQVADNRLARSRYEILERLEVGIALLGTEVKSCRKGNINLRDGFANIKGDECWLMNVHIGKHETTGRSFQHEEKRERRLLLRRKQINKLGKEVDTKGLTLVPLRCYFNEGNLLKVELGLVRGLKDYDKRAQLKDRVMTREVQREVKDYVNR